jgi:hypothetical protein
VHLGTDLHQQLRHHLDVADPRHILENAFLCREQAGSEQRKRSVLVPTYGNGAGDGTTSINQQTRHQNSPR